MVTLPSAEPSEVNAVEIIQRLRHLHTSQTQQNSTCPQSIYSQVSPSNNGTTNSPQNNATYPHDQSTVFLQQFSMIMQELRNFTGKVSSDITKITQAYTPAKKNTGKLIENMIWQALTKSQDSTPPYPGLDSRCNQKSNSSYEVNWKSSWPTTNYAMQQQPSNDTYHLQRPCETSTSPQAYVNQHSPNQNTFDFNKSVFELFWWETELTHSTHQLYQQTADAWNNTAKSSSFQENQHFISDIPIFKAKDPQLLKSGYNK